MAIKDMIGPGFVGTNTIKWIVTRGLLAGASAATEFVGPVCVGAESFSTPDVTEDWASADVTGEAFRTANVSGETFECDCC